MLGKDKYEISLWEDELIAAFTNVEGNKIPEHYEEKKIAIIGSNTMTSQCRAIDPKLVENINGTNTFTFKMYYTYVDTETGKRETNPFLKLLVNERKVKVLWKGKWYDLIIKSIQENSGDKSITYTCKDLFVNELSKTGFDLEFDNELMNNQGTVQDLGELVLEGTDWSLAEAQDDIIQYKEEPVYELTTLADFETNEGITVAVGTKILVFYSVVQNQSNFFQFIYKEDGQYLTEENSQLLVNGECLSADVNWAEGAVQIDSTEIIKLPETLLVSDNYRGKRKVQTQKQIFDSVMDKYVSVYTRVIDEETGEKETIYGYSQTEFKDATFVNNLIVNNKDFSSTSGWIGDNVVYKLHPWFNKDTDLTNYSPTSYLKVSGTVLNQGLYESIIYIPNGFQVGEKYIFRVKGKLDSEDNPVGNNIANQISPLISNYTLEEDGKITTTGAGYFSISYEGINGDWYEYELTCNTAITKQELLVGTKVDGKLVDIGFFLNCSTTCWIQEVEFFPLVIGEEEARIEPGKFDTLSLAQTMYYYYKADKALDPDNVKYLWVDTKPWDDPKLKPETNGYTKIRSITVKNSNRFNILQTLAETFECWIKFEIEHDEETGKVLYNEDGTPKKWVSFLTEVGQETGIGFVYGIDLKTIQRTINSDQITTKVIVSSNNNEYAKNGMCTIARSDENYSKQSFILNFDYYINQGLLDGGVLNNDLYSTTSEIGYYPKLNQWSLTHDALTEKLIQRKDEFVKYDSLHTVCAEQVTAYLEEIKNLEYQMIAYVAGNTMSDVEARLKEYPDDSWASTKYNTWVQNNKLYNYYLAQRDSLESAVAQCRAEVEAIEKEQEALVKNMDELHLAFYKKYSRFIQEGSWTSEEYIDDNLYYLDALSVAYTSSRPKITYNISVIRLSSIEEFKNKVFRLGDITFIQDTEFFGYVYINGVRTPYKEKVLVSEITSFFDSPEKDTFKIQNYKSQFEDLFQRITATTQSLQYASGEYARAANAFTETGEIKVETLQNSFNVNQQFVISAQNESVITDHTGITVTDTSDPSQKTKLTSGGIFISTDGGATWKNAIRGEGLSTQYLTAGTINANNIMILDGAHPTFRWDTKGLNAFWKDDYGTNFSKFVRFDYNGLYGINGDSDFDPAEGTEEIESVKDAALAREKRIWDEAQFALTWKGFSLKNDDKSGYLRISSTDDIIAVDESGFQRIKIGRLKKDNGQTVYGIALKNSKDITTLETDDTGELWLRSKMGIGTLDTSQVAIGYLDEVRENTDFHEIIRAGDTGQEFIVYEDGYFEATGAKISGTVIADSNSTFAGLIEAGTIKASTIEASTVIAGSGSLGNLTVGNVVQTIQDTKKLDIQSDLGYNFKVGADAVSPSVLTLTVKPLGFTISEPVIWQGSSNFTSWSNLGEGETLELTYDQIKEYDVYYISASADGYISYETIYIVRDGQDGSAGISYEVEVSTNDVINFRESSGVVLSPNEIELYVYKVQGTTKEKVEDFKDWKFSLYIVPNSNYSSLTHVGDDENFFRKEYVEENGELKLNESFLHKRTILLDAQSENTEFNNFLLNKEGIILIKIFPLDSSEIVLPIDFRYGLSSEMATFNIHAAGFNSVIDKSQLSFTDGKLQLTNAIIRAEKTTENGEKLVSFEIDTNGNAYFSGNLDAATGNFSGEINATGGEIGGFTIEGNRLVSSDGGIELNGEDNKIIANVISLGTGANIVDYIALGEARLYNPGSHNGIVIQAGNNFYISQDGTARFGEMIVNNEGGLQSAVGQWSIDSEGNAIFDNIRANSCTIGTSILEINTVQAVGNTMIFKNAGRVIEINEDESGKRNKLITDEQITVKKDDNVIVSCGINKILTKVSEYAERDESSVINDNTSQMTIVGSIITIEDSLNEGFLPNETIITVLGQNGDFIFSINSDKYIPAGYDFLSPTALTLANINGENFEKTLVLGKLEGLNLQYTDFNVSGIGLYADNVYLKGALTTQVSDNSYAGVNTKSGVTANIFDKPFYVLSLDTSFDDNKTYYKLGPSGYEIIESEDQYDASIPYYERIEKDTSKIVFWAGAQTSEEDNIKKAPFQVTEMGSIYASQGQFTGSIIANSFISQTDIYGAKIYTAEIHGWNQNEDKAGSLSIYDSSNGIIFKEETTNNELFRINSSGLGLPGQPNFISINNKEITFTGKAIDVDSINTNFLNIGTNPQMKITSDSLSSQDVLFAFNTNKEFSLSATDKTNLNNISFASNDLLFQSEIISFHSKEKFKYQIVNDNEGVFKGYDLYIS